MDCLSKERRSWNMSRIRGRDTKPELIIRSMLHRMGYRFRVHVKSLPGKPDIVLPKHKTVILVHGCFWHRHSRCPYCYSPKSRKDFWDRKFAQNIARDRLVRRLLRRSGWQVAVIWECQSADQLALSRRLKHLLAHG